MEIKKLGYFDDLRLEVEKELIGIKVYEVITADDYAKASKDIATLRKLDKEVNRKRIDFNNDFNANVKKLLTPVNTKINDFKAQIDNYDNLYKDNKKNQIQALYKELDTFYNLETVWDDRYYNKTFTLEEIIADIKIKVAKIDGDFKLLENINVENTDRLLTIYLDVLDVSKAKELYDLETNNKVEVKNGKYNLSYETDQETHDKIIRFIKALGVNIG